MSLLAGRNRKLYFRPQPCGDTDEATSGEEDTVVSIVQQQIQSTQQASVREQVIKKYDLLVEGVELMPICLSVLPKSQEKVCRIRHSHPLTVESRAHSTNPKSQILDRPNEQKFDC